MSQTITGLALTQLSDGTNKVNVAATATESANANLAISYAWKLSSDSVYKPATVTGPANVSGTQAGAAVAAVWDLDTDYQGTALTGSFNFQVTSVRAAQAATGSIVVVAANATTGVAKGDTVVVLGKTYEFTTDGVVSNGHVAVAITATSTATQVRNAFIAALSAKTSGVIATASGPATILITAVAAGTAGNAAVTATFANVGVTFTMVGLAGGTAETTVSASATLAGATTGSHAPAVVTTVTNPFAGRPNTKYIYVFEQENKHGFGEMTTDFLKGAVAYSALDALRSGKYQKFEYVNDRSGRTTKRAVLISVAEFQRVTSGIAVPVLTKSKQWLAYKAWRAFSRLFVKGTEVYAIYEDKLVSTPGHLTNTQTIIGYLMSYEHYNFFLN